MITVSNEIDFDSASNVYYVRGQDWPVGQDYKLHRVLGAGSFSCVCLATCKATGAKVALKRIPDVCQSTDNAKRVLRELCILSRLSHPYCISLKHAFALPSQTGAWKFKNGEFVPCSIDLYLAMEYGDGGDLQHLRGQLSERDVRRLMWQILTAVEYLHAENVWHRDLKSANILLTVENGKRICKVADFGSARSGSSTAFHRESELGFRRQSSVSIDSNMMIMDIEHQSLTRTVCTPCYRAPEVVMSRGGYTEALDMWSVGCIFAELLQRVSYVGSASTPQLIVLPVFCITGLPPTLKSGDQADEPENPAIRCELEALFKVIGTPGWACIEKVRSNAWKRYLRKMPIRAATLHRRFGNAGEVAIDLLSRLLTFDPSRRCSAREAMNHEYFEEFWEPGGSGIVDPMYYQNTDTIQSEYDEPSSPYHQISNPARALAVLEEEMITICDSPSGVEKLQSMIIQECDLLAQSQSLRLGTLLSGQCGSADKELARRCMKDGPSEFGELLKEGLIADPNCDKNLKPENFGPGRLSHVADFSKAHLDVEKHLAVGRQEEWSVISGCGEQTVNYWGVSLVPPGTDQSDTAMQNIIRSQQLR